MTTDGRATTLTAGVTPTITILIATCHGTAPGTTGTHRTTHHGITAPGVTTHTITVTTGDSGTDIITAITTIFTTILKITGFITVPAALLTITP